MAVAFCLQLAWSTSVVAQTPVPTADAEPAAPVDAAADWAAQSGIASFYGRAHQGRRTAWGTRFDQMAMTAAHATLPFGTKVWVTLEGTGRRVLVTITDRIGTRRRIIDLSLAAARSLGFVGQGLAHVSLSPG